jgi:hypothetical protein
MIGTETVELVLPNNPEFIDIEPATDVAERIIDIIGQDNVVALESDAALIDVYEKLHQRENPFLQASKNPLDLSIVDPKTANLVNDFRNSDEPLGKISSKRGVLRGVKEGHVTKLILAAQSTRKTADQLLNQKSEDLHAVRSHVLDLSPMDNPRKPSAEDLEAFQYENTSVLLAQQFQEISGQLADIANKLPGSETSLVLKQIFAKVHDYYSGLYQADSAGLSNVQRVILQKAASANARFVSDLEGAVESCDNLNTQGLKTIEYGKETHDLLNTEIILQEYQLALSTIQTARKAENNIRTFCESNPDCEQLDAYRLSEEFLKERVNAAAEIVRANLSPEERRKFNQFIEFEFGESGVSMAEARKELKEQQADPTTFSSLVSEARDILKGGRRLDKYGNEKRVHELADQLKLLRKEDKVGETRILEVEDRGLIIAITTGRLRDFLDTYVHVKMEHPDRALHDLEKLRPNEVELIRGFDLPDAMERLTNLITQKDTLGLLSEVLSASELSVLEDTLNQYLTGTEQNIGDESQRLSEVV